MANEMKKENYEKPVLTKHAQLREVTLSSVGSGGKNNGNKAKNSGNNPGQGGGNG